jgi:RNA polymerase sigma-70 factor (ECF subfamily)
VISIVDTELHSAANPEADAEAADVVDRLRQGISRLPRLQREVFLMRSQQGMEYDDIARALDTTPGAARVHYHHAVKRLKEIIA